MPHPWRVERKGYKGRGLRTRRLATLDLGPTLALTDMFAWRNSGRPPARAMRALYYSKITTADLT